jgi:hypothetical protein
MFEVEVDDLGQRVHLGRLEVANEFCQTFLELGVYEKRSVGADWTNKSNTYKQQAQSNSVHQ